MAFHADNRNKFLEDRLNHPKPIHSRKTNARIKNIKHAHYEKKTATNPRWAKQKQWKTNCRQRQSLVWLSAAYLLVIGLLFGSWRTAYAAMDSLPNEPLYSVKLVGEDLQLLLTSDTTARTALLTTFANRRADEATILTSQGKPIPEEVTTLIDEYQEELAALSASLEDEPTSEGVYVQKQPRDRDKDENGNHPREMERKSHPDPKEEDQSITTSEIETPVFTTTITGTLEVSGTLSITPIRLGPGYGPGPCETPGSCPPPIDHSSGPFTGPGNHEGYGPGSSTGVAPQQPPATLPSDGIDKPKQPANNNGKKP